MQLSYKKVREFFVIELPKNIFVRENINDLRNLINSLIGEDAKDILLNLSELDKVDGIGLGVFLAIQKIALFNEVNISLFGLKSHIKEVFEQTRLNKVLDIREEYQDLLLEVSEEDIRVA